MSYVQVHAECTEAPTSYGESHRSYPIHREADGTHHLDSCDSHGGCVAATGIEFCPYCGKRLAEAEVKS